MRGLLVLVLIMTVFLCENVSAKEKDVLAKIGDRVITMSDFDLFLGDYPQDQKKMLMMDKKKQKELLEIMVQSIVLGDVARSKGIHKKPGIKEKLEFTTNELLAKEYIKEEVVGKLNLSDKDMEHFYNLNKEEFTTPEKIKVKHIFIKAGKGIREDIKKQALQKAENVIKRLKAGESFSKVASEVSDDTLTKARGGEVGFIEKGRLFPELDKIAFSIQPGKVSDIIESAQGYHIILVEDKKAAELLPFEKIKEDVKKKYITIKVKEYINKELNKAKAEIYIR